METNNLTDILGKPIEKGRYYIVTQGADSGCMIRVVSYSRGEPMLIKLPKHRKIQNMKDITANLMPIREDDLKWVSSQISKLSYPGGIYGKIINTFNVLSWGY